MVGTSGGAAGELRCPCDCAVRPFPLFPSWTYVLPKSVLLRLVHQRSSVLSPLRFLLASSALSRFFSSQQWGVHGKDNLVDRSTLFPDVCG